MVRSDKVFQSGFDNNYNLLLLLVVVLAVLGSLFLARKDVRAGIIYTLMFVTGLGLMYFVTLLLKGEGKDLESLTSFARIPFSPTLGIACFFGLVGFFLPILLKTIFSFTNFSVSGLSIPLFGSGINTAFQSFSAAEIGSSLPWQIFTTVFTAGVIETLIFSFVTIYIGIGLGVVILKLLSGKNTSPSRWAVLTFAFVFSVMAFTLSHLLNSTYVLSSFIFAGIFLLISNISIFVAGGFLVFWIFYHMSNNLIYLIEVKGLEVIITQGLFSGFGLVLVGLLLLMLFYVISRWSVKGGISTQLKDYFAK